MELWTKGIYNSFFYIKQINMHLFLYIYITLMKCIQITMRNEVKILNICA